MDNKENPAVEEETAETVKKKETIKKGKKSKKEKKKKEAPAKVRYSPLKPRKRFALLPAFWIYAVFWVLCLVFTQALQSSLSSVLFLFATILPYFNLAFVFIARNSVKVEIENSAAEVAKLEAVSFNVRVVNDSPLPLPFVEADVLVPNETSVRCQEKRMYLSVAPKAAYEVKDTVKFSYRGEYDMGVTNVFFYDFFKMFRLKLEIYQFNPVYVTPRRLNLEHITENAASDVNTESQKNQMGIDRAEMAGIRQYRMGDHMKTIHWKLSSKTEDLQVKEYAMNTGKTAYIFVDLAKNYNNEQDELFADDINEYCADGVVEIAIAAAMREVKAGNNCNLIWYDHRIPGGTQICHLESPDDLERNFKLFSTAGLCDKDNEVAKLVALIDETQGVSVIFITAKLDSRLIDGISEASSLINNVSSSGAVELFYYNPTDCILDPAEKERHKELAESCKAQLSTKGVTVAELRI